MKVTKVEGLEKIAKEIRKNIIKTVYSARFRASGRLAIMCRYFNRIIF